MNDDHRIPVTILTGFLGSGKTTTLNTIIRENPEKKLAIIENEFGEINIDSDLIVGIDDSIFELSNGCICCSLNDDLVETLQMLLEKTGPLDHLIVETTGIADPGPVALNFLTDFQIQNVFRLDAIITVVDAQFFLQQLQTTEILTRQIANADIVLINKSDKINSEELNQLKHKILELNPQTDVIQSVFGKVDSVNLLNINAFSVGDSFVTLFERNRINNTKFSIIQNTFVAPFSLRESIRPNKSINHFEVASHSFEFPEPLDFMKFDIWVSVLLNLNPENIFRIKGILNFNAVNDKVIFQSVYNQFVSASGGHWENEQERISRLVIIGKNISEQELALGLKKCLYNPEWEGVDVSQLIK
jgi:G3E family GTPase